MNDHRLRIYLEPRDVWVGYYRGPHHHYVCLLPCVVISWPRKLKPKELWYWTEVWDRPRVIATIRHYSNKGMPTREIAKMLRLELEFVRRVLGE